MPPLYSPKNNAKRLAEDGNTFATLAQQLAFLSGRHWQKIAKEHSERMQKAWNDFQLNRNNIITENKLRKEKG